MIMNLCCFTNLKSTHYDSRLLIQLYKQEKSRELLEISGDPSRKLLKIQTEMEVGGDFSTEVNKRASATPDSFEESNVSKSDVSSAEAYAQTGAHGGVQNGSPTQSPPIQTMTRSEGYDPNRIPASVFASKAATTPLEWSVASSESLFSIHVGNPSFTNEFSQLSKSGELFKSPENQPPSGLPPVTEAADMEKGRQTSAETTKGVSWESADVKEKMPPPLSEGFRNSSASHHSDESMNSTLSFAFPV